MLKKEFNKLVRKELGKAQLKTDRTNGFSIKTDNTTVAIIKGGYSSTQNNTVTLYYNRDIAMVTSFDSECNRNQQIFTSVIPNPQAVALEMIKELNRIN